MSDNDTAATTRLQISAFRSEGNFWMELQTTKINNQQINNFSLFFQFTDNNEECDARETARLYASSFTITTSTLIFFSLFNFKKGRAMKSKRALPWAVWLSPYASFQKHSHSLKLLSHKLSPSTATHLSRMATICGFKDGKVSELLFFV